MCHSSMVTSRHGQGSRRIGLPAEHSPDATRWATGGETHSDGSGAGVWPQLSRKLGGSGVGDSASRPYRTTRDVEIAPRLPGSRSGRRRPARVPPAQAVLAPTNPRQLTSIMRLHRVAEELSGFWVMVIRGAQAAH